LSKREGVITRYQPQKGMKKRETTTGGGLFHHLSRERSKLGE